MVRAKLISSVSESLRSGCRICLNLVLLLLFLLPNTPGSVNVAASSGLSIALDDAITGTAPFDTGSCISKSLIIEVAGNDACATNSVVRTLDKITYSVAVSSSSGIATNGTFVIDLPKVATGAHAGKSAAIFELLPPQCSGSGSRLANDSRSLICNLGTLSPGTVSVINVPAMVTIFNPNGANISVSASLSAGSQGSPVISNSVTNIVSARPDYDLCNNRPGTPGCSNGILLDGVGAGPDGQTVGYFIRIGFQFPNLRSNAGRGDEILDAPFSITNQITDENGQGVGAVLDTFSSNGNGSLCGLRNASVWGQTSCTQTSPGGPVQLSITFNPIDVINYPLQSMSGGAYGIPTQGELRYWIPLSSVGNVGQSKIFHSLFSGFDPNSITGASNQGSLSESDTNNLGRITLSNTGYSAKINNCISAGISESFFCSNDGWGVVGTAAEYNLMYANTGSLPITNAVICDTIDNTKVRAVGFIQRRTSSFPAGRRDSGLNLITEYGTGGLNGIGNGWSSEDDQRLGTCNDTDSKDGWFSNINDVPGGAQNVTKVRIRILEAIDFGELVSVDQRYTILPNPDRTLVKNFAKFKSNEIAGGNWTGGDRWGDTDIYGNSAPWGYSSKQFSVTQGEIRVFLTSQNQSTYQTDVVGGGVVSYKINSHLRTGQNDLDSGAVEYRLTLPVGVRFRPGSANINPVSITSQPDGSQIILWQLSGINPIVCPPNYVNVRRGAVCTVPDFPGNVTPINFEADVAIDIPDGTIKRAIVVASSSFDQSDTGSQLIDNGIYTLEAPNKIGSNAIRISQSSSFNIAKTTSNSIIDPEGKISYKIQYANFDSNVIGNIQIIDILPFNGDQNSNPTPNRTPGSRFTGSVSISDIVTSHGEIVEYTKTSTGLLRQDPQHISNQNGGASVWCSSLAGGSCPASLSEVTAVRFTIQNMPAPIAPATTLVRDIILELSTSDNYDDSVYANTIGAKASNTSLSVFSSPILTRVSVPVAADEVVQMQEDSVLDIDVLDNDSELDGDLLSICPDSVTTPDNATLEIVDNRIRFTPGADYYGQIIFNYRACDEDGHSSAAAQVTVNVLPANDLPTAVSDEVQTLEDSAVYIDVLQNDSDIEGQELQICPNSVTSPSNGSVEIIDNRLQYLPDPDFYGTDSFFYKACDMDGESNSTRVDVIIEPVNDNPIANNDIATTDSDQPVDIDVLDNDLDIDSTIDSTWLEIISQPQIGRLNFADGVVEYTPDQSLILLDTTDTFTYSIRDEEGLVSAPATVTVTIRYINQPPSIQPQDITTYPTSSATFFQLPNRDQTDNQTIVYRIQNLPDGIECLLQDYLVTCTPSAWTQPGEYTFEIVPIDSLGLEGSPVAFGIRVGELHTQTQLTNPTSTSQIQAGDTVTTQIAITNPNPVPLIDVRTRVNLDDQKFKLLPNSIKYGAFDEADNLTLNPFALRVMAQSSTSISQLSDTSFTILIPELLPNQTIYYTFEARTLSAGMGLITAETRVFGQLARPSNAELISEADTIQVIPIIEVVRTGAGDVGPYLLVILVVAVLARFFQLVSVRKSYAK